MVTPFDYNIIQNLNLNVRVSRTFVVTDEAGKELFRDLQIDHAQAVLSMSDMEDMLEQANSVADSVTIYHKKDTTHADLTEEQLRLVRPDITAAIAVLIDNITNEEFVGKYVKAFYPEKPGHAKICRFTYQNTRGNYETTVSLYYLEENLLAENLIYMNRPGAVINRHQIIEYD